MAHRVDSTIARTMIPLADARHYVLQGLAPLAPVELALDDALGCVAADVVTAREPSPRFDNSSMDGFALRAVDTVGGSAQLRVTNSIFAGDHTDDIVADGEAMRIMTGAPLPQGADSVCMREEATLDPDGASVFISREIRRGESVRLVGEDVSVGQALLDVGAEIGPALLGVLYSQGITSLLAHPRPRVGVLSTGNELSNAADLAPGQIRDSNRPSLLASLRQSGFTPVDLGTVGDSPAQIAEAFQRGLGSCDAIVSTGGVSVGDADYVKTVVAELCGERARSMQVAIKPGKPFTFGLTNSGTPLFALAGNPVSTLVGFELFVRPALRLLAGQRDLERPTINAVLDVAIPRHRDGKTHFVHVVAQINEDGTIHVVRAARQASHLMHAIASSNALAVVEDGDGLNVGETVPMLILEPSQLRAA
jgi:molybdenum cofactor synthesis domain-containing protein